MSAVTQYDQWLYNRVSADPDLSANTMLLPELTITSALVKGKTYTYFPKDCKASLCYTTKFLSIQPLTSVPTSLFANGSLAYIDFKLTNISNGLFKEAYVILNMTNNSGSNVANLVSSPLLWSQIRLLLGGTDVTSSFLTQYGNWIECVHHITESFVEPIEMTMYGLNATSGSYFNSNLSIGTSATQEIISPLFFTLNNTLIPLGKLSQCDTVIRLFINPNIIYSGSATLANLQLNSALLYVKYVEVCNSEYAPILNTPVQNFKALSRRLETFTPPSSLTAANTYLFLFQATRGVWSAMAVWISNGTSGTNTDLFNGNITSMWIADSKNVNIFNQIQWKTAELKLMAVKSFGMSGASFNASLNTAVYWFVPFAIDASGIFRNEHSSGYVFQSTDVPTLNIIPSSTLTGVTINCLTYIFSNLSLFQNGQLTESIE